MIAYDDLAGMAAGRLVWLLRILRRQAALLDGGLAAWPGSLEAGNVAVPAVTPATIAWPKDRFANAEDVARATAPAGKAGTTIVLDARAPERFRGDIEPIDPRAGHIPGAVNAAFMGNLATPDGTFLDAAALRARYEDLGVTDTGDLIVYCGSGVSACHDLLALELAGFPTERARLYGGSWSQWSAESTRPVATGAD